MIEPEPCVIRPGALLPCCSRVPILVGRHRYACRGCGTVYRDARAIVETIMGPCRDVTAMAPSRLVARGHRLVRVER